MANGKGGDVRKDGQTSGNSPLCPTGHRPFGAAAQKANLREGGRLEALMADFRPGKLDIGLEG